MNFSTDVEKIYDKIQPHLVIKTFDKLVTDGDDFNDEGHLRNPQLK